MINIGFNLLWEGQQVFYDLADVLVNSVRRTMPDAVVTMFTDETSPKLESVDRVRRLPKDHLNFMRCRHMQLVTGNWVLVDVDVYFQADVSNVFEKPFDIGLTDRNWPHLPSFPFILNGMQSNVGVVFSQNPTFWFDVERWLLNHPEHQRDWYGDQRAICEVAKQTKWLIRALPGAIYNYPPIDSTDNAETAQIVHCKGPRKEWMLKKRVTLCA